MFLKARADLGELVPLLLGIRLLIAHGQFVVEIKPSSGLESTPMHRVLVV